MKRMFTMLMLIGFSSVVFSQKYSSPVEYLNDLNKETKQINKDTWDYISAVSHGKSARKVENRRKDLIETIQNAKKKVISMPGYNGDKSLRDSTISFLKMSYDVMVGDYSKIVDMEAVAEQSYDAMEAYMMAQELASDKVKAAADMLNLQTRAFCDANGITYTTEKSELELKMEIASQVIDYYNVIYLTFFKSYKQEAYLLDAQNKMDLNALEQNRTTLIKFAKEGMDKLKSLEPFKNDLSIRNACSEMLEFYLMEAEEKMPVVTEFFMKKESYEKVKAAFEAKRDKDRTNDDVKQINAAGEEYNKAVNEFNAVNNELNKKRTELLNKWNKSVATFMDKHVPQKR